MESLIEYNIRPYKIYEDQIGEGKKKKGYYILKKGIRKYLKNKNIPVNKKKIKINKFTRPLLNKISQSFIDQSKKINKSQNIKDSKIGKLYQDTFKNIQGQIHTQGDTTNVYNIQRGLDDLKKEVQKETTHLNEIKNFVDKIKSNEIGVNQILKTDIGKKIYSEILAQPHISPEEALIQTFDKFQNELQIQLNTANDIKNRAQNAEVLLTELIEKEQNTRDKLEDSTKLLRENKAKIYNDAQRALQLQFSIARSETTTEDFINKLKKNYKDNTHILKEIGFIGARGDILSTSKIKTDKNIKKSNWDNSILDKIANLENQNPDQFKAKFFNIEYPQELLEQENQNEEEQKQDIIDPNIELEGEGIKEDNNGLDESQINYIMLHFDKLKYVKTFAYDEFWKYLENTNNDDFCCIFNVLERNNSNKVGHWIAFNYSKKERVCEIFDSLAEGFGRGELEEIVHFIRRMNDFKEIKWKLMWNNTALQSINSSNCGWFAMNFLILRRLFKVPFEDAINSKGVKNNEKNIEKIKYSFQYI